MQAHITQLQQQLEAAAQTHSEHAARHRAPAPLVQPPRPLAACCTEANTLPPAALTKPPGEVLTVKGPGYAPRGRADVNRPHLAPLNGRSHHLSGPSGSGSDAKAAQLAHAGTSDSAPSRSLPLHARLKLQQQTQPQEDLRQGCRAAAGATSGHECTKADAQLPIASPASRDASQRSAPLRESPTIMTVSLTPPSLPGDSAAAAESGSLPTPLSPPAASAAAAEVAAPGEAADIMAAEGTEALVGSEPDSDWLLALAMEEDLADEGKGCSLEAPSSPAGTAGVCLAVPGSISAPLISDDSHDEGFTALRVLSRLPGRDPHVKHLQELPNATSAVRTFSSAAPEVQTPDLPHTSRPGSTGHTDSLAVQEEPCNVIELDDSPGSDQQRALGRSSSMHPLLHGLSPMGGASRGPGWRGLDINSEQPRMSIEQPSFGPDTADTGHELLETGHPMQTCARPRHDSLPNAPGASTTERSYGGSRSAALGGSGLDRKGLSNPTCMAGVDQDQRGLLHALPAAPPPLSSNASSFQGSSSNAGSFRGGSITGAGTFIRQGADGRGGRAKSLLLAATRQMPPPAQVRQPAPSFLTYHKLVQLVALWTGLSSHSGTGSRCYLQLIFEL